MVEEQEVTKKDLDAIAKYVFNVPAEQYDPNRLVECLQARLDEVHQALLLRRANGETFTAIAQSFGVSVSAVRARIGKATRRLKYSVYKVPVLFSAMAAERDKYKKLWEELLNKNQDSLFSPPSKLAAVGIEDLGLSVRAYNCLNRAGILTLADLAIMTENDFLPIRNLGRKAIEEIIAKLLEVGIVTKRCGH